MAHEKSLPERRKSMQMVRPNRKRKVTRESDENRLLECALEARADYVVAGNLRRFPKQYRYVRVVAPKPFLMMPAAQAGGL
jgi:predicted nucleic acid-binding protein